MYVVLAALLLPLAVAVPFLAEAPLAAFFLMSLPAGALGAYCAICARRLSRSLIRVDHDGVLLRIPRWEGGAMLEGGEVRFPFSAVTRVTFERRVYAYAQGIAVDEWDIHADGGVYTLTRTICPRPGEVAELIASRAGRPVERLG